VASYLKLPNCPIVGGSWVTPAELVRAGDWPAITALAKAAASMAP
jgi:2-dehydro-3-deoxyphosphogluconate aldolase/(4S)-4-hydroxy-2-oxoglutarate aldolase